MRSSHSAITLIEIMISMLIVSFVMVSAFQVLSYVGIAKVKIIEKSQIEKEAFFASERLIDLIKKGGSIDYEEYWNRQAIGNTSFLGGYFSQPSGFGNEGTMYFCLSGVGDSNRLAGNGCLSGASTQGNRLMNSTVSISRIGQQRYGQYRLQYIDHNSDANDDYGDVSRTLPNYTNFIGDDDDLFLGQGPDTFDIGTDAGELYLINASGDERTYFRWKFTLDSDAPSSTSCPISTPGIKQLTGTGCLGTIQMLKLIGRDYGNNHDVGIVDSDGSQGDGVIDTWLIHPDFVSDGSEIVAGSVDMNPYWQNIFSNRIHVSRAEFYLYPNQNLNYAWADSRADLQVAPYLQLRITLEPSWKERRRIRGEVPVVNIATTVSLSQVDIF